MLIGFNMPAVRKLLIRAVTYWGMEKQKRKAEEELLELAIALKRDIDKRDTNVEEEIADVIIMINQLLLFYNQHKVNKYIEEKLERLAQRLNELDTNEREI